jgi:PAS domain S-box-containing protein
MVAPIRVLHVDDDPRFGQLVSDFLERVDDRIEVVAETSARAGLEALAEREVDCVVSDYDMPRTDGLEFLQTVRERHGDLPFVLFTGKGSEAVASDAITHGATDYLQKGGGTEQYELLANRIANAVSGHRAERDASEQAQISAVVRGIDQALVRAESSDEIERRVCEILTEADRYHAACVAGVDPETDHIEPRTWAGVDDDYFEDFEMAVGGDDAGRSAPAGRAVREEAVAVSQDIDTDPDYEPWAAAAGEQGVRSLAVVPLDHDGESHGLLAVFAAVPDAFDAEERALLSDLGDDVAHALRAREVQLALQRTSSRLRTLFEESPDMINVHDAAGNLLDPNPRLLAETGYTEAELTDMAVWDLDREYDAETLRELWAGMDPGDRAHVESEYERKDGSTFPVEVHIRRFDACSEDRFVAIARRVDETPETSGPTDGAGSETDGT